MQELTEQIMTHVPAVAIEASIGRRHADDWRRIVARSRRGKQAGRAGRRSASVQPAPDGCGFGPRLAQLRQAQGLTQEELGLAVGLSNRMIAYYEREDAQPPGALLGPLATALQVTTDELLGLTATRATTRPRTARLLKRLRQIEELPPADQRALLKVVDALLTARQSPTNRKAG